MANAAYSNNSLKLIVKIILYILIWIWNLVYLGPDPCWV